jgi:phage shock protein E
VKEILPRLLILAVLCATPALAAEPPPPAVPDIAADALVGRQSTGDASLLILDVRSADEYAQGHVPGAINVPHDQLEGRLASLPELRDHDLVVYCRSGRRSALALEVLKRHGYTRLQHLAGDMEGWQGASRPIERPPPP